MNNYKTQHLVSVIVPIFNSAQFLKKCINSLIKQSYKNIEILLIDDGSTDLSSNICLKYVHLDSRVKYFKKNNTGVSDTRNFGIKISTGFFLCFVDSDDWLPKRAIESLVHNLYKYDSDLSCGEILNVLPFRNHIFYHHQNACFSVNDDTDLITFFKSFDGGPCAKLFKKSIIERNGVLFDTNILCMEDSIFLIDYISNCEKVSLLSEIVYFYNKLNNDSAMKKHWEKYVDWKLIYLKKRIHLYHSNTNESIKEKNRLICIELNACINHYYYLPISDYKNKVIMILNLFKTEFKSIDTNCSVNKDEEINKIKTIESIKSGNNLDSILQSITDAHTELTLKQKIYNQIGIIKKTLIFRK